MAEALVVGSPGGPATVRVGDAERDSAAAALAEHFAAGRLQPAELDARLEAAYAARTVADLGQLFLDLPAPGFPQPVRVTAAPVRSGWAGRPHPPVPMIVLILLVVAMAHAALPPFLLVPFFFGWLGRRRRSWQRN